MLAGCGGGHAAASTEASTAPPPTVIASPPQTVTFAGLRRSIERLYRHQPAIRGFVARGVQYTPATRDKVLAVCRRGGFEQKAAARESAKVAGCAPLVFFFYRYGVQRSAPEAVDVARKVYWYAVSSIGGPFDATETLTALLHSWGIR